MAQLVLGAVGYAVGFYFGGPAGGSAGFAVGSAIGGALDPPKAPDGPRLDDLRVQISTYGAVRTRVWGTFRASGNVIWSTDLQEAQQAQSGKGGSSYSTFSYSVSMAVALCEGEITGISRIWADGKLIYDIRPANKGVQQLFTAASMVLYTGSESQGIDPTIQAINPDTPAYLGLAYIVFTELQLEKFGNRIPNLTFEIVKDGVTAVPPPLTFGERFVAPLLSFQSDMTDDGLLWVSTEVGHAVNDPTLGMVLDFGVTPTNQVQWYEPETQTLLGFHTVDLDMGSTVLGGKGRAYGDTYYVGRGGPGPAIAPQPNCPGTTSYCASPQPYVHGTGFTTTGQLKFKDTASSGQFQNAFYWPSTPLIQTNQITDPRAISPFIYWMGGNGLAFGLGIGFLLNGNQFREDAACVCNPFGYPGTFDGISTSASGWVFDTVKTPTGGIPQGYAGTSSSFIGSVTYPGSGVIMPSAVFHEDDNALYVWAGAGSNDFYIDGSASGYSLPAVPGDSFANVVHGLTIDSNTGYLRLLVGGRFAGDVRIVLFNQYTQSIVTDQIVAGLSVNGAPGRLFDFPSQRALLFSDGFHIHWIPYGLTLDPRPVLLSTIVTELSEEAGLTPADIDVTELTDEVIGYAIMRQASTRSAIEQLMQAYRFDSVESEGKIKFVKRGKAPIRDIEPDDLSAHQDGTERPVPLALRREDEASMPKVLSVRYINPGSDYQTGVQEARRQTSRAEDERTIDVPVVLADSTAKAIADITLYSAWTARTKAVFSTTMTHADLEPTDVIRIGGNPVRITKRSMDNGVLRFDGELDSGTILVSGAVAGGIYPPPVPLLPVVATRLLLLDIPILSDLHNDPGYYVAANGLAPAWPGATVIKSSDGGGTYSAITTTTVEAASGSTVSALGSWSENTFDETESLIVRLARGDLSSASELAVLNGANIALVGQEIIQFNSAVLGLDGNHTLRGLLRGRKGTSTAGHIAGERFVLLSSAAVQHVSDTASEIGLTRIYKGVSFGATNESAAPVNFANLAKGLLPLSPVYLHGERNLAGDLAISWIRRTRIDAEWRSSVDAGLGEAAEQYEVEVFDTPSFTTLKRTITTTTPSAAYSAADQVSDFGAAQSAVSVRVYQISAIVGRGAVLQGAA